jgi:hypothetical protein
MGEPENPFASHFPLPRDLAQTALAPMLKKLAAISTTFGAGRLAA